MDEEVYNIDSEESDENWLRSRRTNKETNKD